MVLIALKDYLKIGEKIIKKGTFSTDGKIPETSDSRIKFVATLTNKFIIKIFGK